MITSYAFTDKRCWLFLVIFLILSFSPNYIFAQNVSDSVRYKEDFNDDGIVDMKDVISLLIFHAQNPGDLRGDYNGNGKANVNDAIDLLLAYRNKNLNPVNSDESDIIEITGKISGINLIDPSLITIITPLFETVAKVGQFLLGKIHKDMAFSFATAVNPSGNPVLLSYMGYGQAGLTGISKSKNGSPQLAAVDDIELSPQSTALSIVMLNPLLFGTTTEQRQNFANTAMENDKFDSLVDDIKSVLEADISSNYLVDNSHPEIFEKASEIAIEVYDSIISNTMLQGSSIIPDFANRPDPSIETAENNNLNLINPFYCYQAAGLYSYGDTVEIESFLLGKRSFRWGIIPYSGEYGKTEEDLNPNTDYSISIYRGFNTEDTNKWYSLSYAQGQATWYNCGQAVLSIVDIAVKVSGLEDKLPAIVKIVSDFEDTAALSLAINSGDIYEIIQITISVINRYKGLILNELFQSSSDPSRLTSYTSKINSVLGNVALPLKILNAMSKVPFYYDLFACPDQTTYHFKIENGNIVYLDNPMDVEIIKNITMVSIPGGYFQMGSENGNSNELPVHTVGLSDFEMSAFEITNSQYAAYLNTALSSGKIIASSSTVRGNSGEFIDKEYLDIDEYSCRIDYNNGRFTVESGFENHPVVEVTWYGAKAFAINYNFDLPREAEWEYAARGGYAYEYGTDDGTIDATKANYNNQNELTTEVGSYPPNPFNVYDLAGNVWEWCDDWYSDNYDNHGENSLNPEGPESGVGHVRRGGSWKATATYCRSAIRSYYESDLSYYFLGFRVVRRDSTILPPDMVNPLLEEYSLSLSDPNVEIGTSFTARYKIYNPNSTAIQLKLDLRFRNSAGAYGEFLPYDDPTINVQPGTNWYERSATVPDNLDGGDLDVAWYLLNADRSHITSSGYKPGYITIVSEPYLADPSLEGYSLSLTDPNVEVGTSFTAKYEIHNPNNTAIQVKLDLRFRNDAGVYGEFLPYDDPTINVLPGTKWYERSATVPDNLDDGDLDVAWYLLNADRSNITSSGYKQGYVIVVSEPVIEDPSLEGYSLSLSDPNVEIGTSFTARYKIYNPNSTTIQVKLDLRFRNDAGVYGEFLPYDDATINIQPGTNWYERSATVPDDLDDGDLDVAWYLLNADRSHITSSGYKPGYVIVVSEPVIEDPSLEGYSLSLSDPNVEIGTSFTARYKIYNPNSTTIQVKLDLRFRNDAGVYGEFLPYDDATINIQPGTNWYERSATVPDDLDDGDLDVAWYLLHADRSHITSSGYKPGYVTVGN